MLRKTGESTSGYAYVFACLAALLLLVLTGCKRKFVKR
jgi:hypothetical protein